MSTFACQCHAGERYGGGGYSGSGGGGGGGYGRGPPGGYGGGDRYIDRYGGGGGYGPPPGRYDAPPRGYGGGCEVYCTLTPPLSCRLPHLLHFQDSNPGGTC